MKLLQDILYKSRIRKVTGSTNIAIDKVAFDSRKVTPLSLFVAVRGTRTDGHAYIETALQQRASAIVCERMPENIREGVTYVEVENSAEALSFIASNFYDNPSAQLKVVGITGTNGKTTTATMLYNLFRLLGKKAGLLSTVENRINKEVVEATHTTGDALQVNALLRKMVDAGCKYCFMEVSSHALHQHRVSGLTFTGAVYTNISRDHLDYHSTFNEYIAAKKILFDMLPQEAFALVNLDDKQGAVMLQNTKAAKNTYAIKTLADFKAKIIENQFSGLQLYVDGTDLYSKLIGRFNAYNILAVYSTAVLLGENSLDVLTAVSSLNAAVGRFQYIKTQDNITAIVDYAHTPDALLNVLKTIEEIRNHNEQVITVVGCGGDRDKGKRPEMAKIACDLSDRVIFTSDNPRSEEPAKIIEDMQAGVEPQHYKKTSAIENRKEAIKMACSLAKSGDIILVAGKGHEKYQEIKGERYAFDDLQVLNETFKMLEK